MLKVLPIVLWSAVLVVGGVMIFDRLSGPDGLGTVDRPTGAAMATVPWEHFPEVDRFVLKDQTGADFDSAKLAGKTYAISFFFSTCPSICRDLNTQVQRLNQQMKRTDITFVSVSVDPETDTPEVLGKYAKDFGATPERWALLTGQMYQIKQLGEQQLQVVIDKAHHNDNLLLIDKWGRYRDRFKWDDPLDMKRFRKVASQVAAETEVPLGKSFTTRNVLAGHRPTDFHLIPMIREFHLEQSNGETFYSRDMTGKVWIANFFFTSCPDICQRQAKYLQGLQDRLSEHDTTIVSITTDPNSDRPEQLRAYAEKHSARPDRWIFCTGETALIPRIGAEFFSASSTNGHHSSELFVVDRWGEVRGRFDWQDPSAEAEMLDLIDRLWKEKTPGDYLTSGEANNN